VEIIAVAREPGWRTKLAVHSADSRVDPVGACVGLRGQRVKNIVRELNNEKVDIIHWSPDINTFVIEALKPAEIKSLKINEANKRIQVFVNEDQLSLAIGKRGQNARLAQKLVGWHIDIEADQVEVVSFDDQVATAVAAMTALPGIDDALAQTLVQSGFHSVADLQQAEAADLAEIPDLAPHAETILAALQAGVTEAETTETESETPAKEEAAVEPEAAEEKVVEETEPETEATEEPAVEETKPEAESNEEAEPAAKTTDNPDETETA
jgi:N utilization substance protein A